MAPLCGGASGRVFYEDRSRPAQGGTTRLRKAGTSITRYDSTLEVWILHDEVSKRSDRSKCIKFIILKRTLAMMRCHHVDCFYSHQITIIQSIGDALASGDLLTTERARYT
eukprot:6206787-Pleurochrysis_carterae.AAC.2